MSEVKLSAAERNEIDRIVDIQLGKFRALLKDKDLGIELTAEARTMLGDLGYDPMYGARPLKRAIMRYLQDPLAREIIKGTFSPGDTIVVTKKGDALEFGHRRTEAVETFN